MCLHCAHNLFYTMEEEGLLDWENEVHVCCLHYVFLSRIDNSLQVFKEAWNQHLLSSEGNLSPCQLWIRGNPIQKTYLRYGIFDIGKIVHTFLNH